MNPDKSLFIKSLFIKYKRPDIFSDSIEKFYSRFSQLKCISAWLIFCCVHHPIDDTQLFGWRLVPQNEEGNDGWYFLHD